MQAHTSAYMSAFYFHGDMHDVASLRIRTPKFDSHEEAEEHYYEKRLEKYEARARQRILYSVLVIIAVFTGMYRVYLDSTPKTWGQFLLYFATGALSAMIALTFCSKAMAWLWEITEENDDDNKKNVAAANSNSMV
jgi:hypothetical protein